MNKIKKSELVSLVKECISELNLPKINKENVSIKTEAHKTEPVKTNIKEMFVNMVKEVIEEVKKEKSKSPKKETKESSKDVTDADKRYLTKWNDAVKETDANLSDDEIVKEITKVAQKANKNSVVFLDDHKDIQVKLEGLMNIRIRKNFANNYNIDVYKTLTDRIYSIGQTFEQVKDFVKVNVETTNKSPASIQNYTQKAYDKARANLEYDKETKKDKDIPKTEPVKIKTVDKKDKEDAVKNKEDKPDQPYAEVPEKDIEKQSDHKVDKSVTKKKVSDKSTKSDDKLTVNFKK